MTLPICPGTGQQAIDAQVNYDWTPWACAACHGPTNESPLPEHVAKPPPEVLAYRIQLLEARLAALESAPPPSVLVVPAIREPGKVAP